MNIKPRELPGRQAPLGQLERSLIDEFVRARGFDPAKLADLPARERQALLAAASVHASTKLTEIESRSHFIHEIRGDHPGQS
jgi:hypothetical protein